MNKHVATVLTTVIVIVLAGAGALFLAESVNNRPGPVFISRFEENTTTTTRPRPAPSISVPSTNDDTVAARSDDSATPTTIEDRAAGVTSSSTVSVPGTVDDHGVDAPTSLDDHGGHRGRSGSGSVSRSGESGPSAP